MEEAAALIRALAALAWPAIVLFVLVRFEPQMRELLSRIKRGKIAGAEIELSEKLDNLLAAASEAATDAEQLAAGAPDTNPAIEPTTDADRSIIAEVSRSPKAALLLLTSELEKAVRHLLAALAMTKRPLPLKMAIHELERRGVVPKSIVEVLDRFTDVRNRLVHGHFASDDDIIRALDAGLLILRSIQTAPQPVATIRHVQIPLYADPNATVPRPEISGLIVEVTNPESMMNELRVLPTREGHFEIGRRIGWAYSYERDYDETWYRDPDTGTITLAWSYSKEFIGKHLEEM